MSESIEDCALDYANLWFSKERALVAALASGNRVLRLAALQRAAGHFRIARNMPRDFDVHRGRRRLSPVLSILGEQPFQRVTSNNLTEVVGSLRRRIGERYGNRDLLSAATKLLWLFHRESVVIFDSQARVALGATHRDYDAYLGRWRDEFARTEPAIRKACRALPGRRSAMSLTDEVSADHVREVSRQEWFRMRVLDIHLWNRGARLLRRR